MMPRTRGKNNIIHKLIIFLLIISANINCFSLPVFAAESGTCGDELSWTLSNGHLIISGSGEMTNFTDENMPPWYESTQEIKRVTLEDGVKNVGSLAFYSCSNLKSVTLPASLTAIGTRAFKDCTALPYIGFPEGLTSISEAAFENCEVLRGIRLPNGLKTIGDYAFYRCYGLTSITVPSSVQSFGMVVFAYCEGLTQATIECSLTRLPDWTFYGCKNLSSVVLPETVTSSGEYAFHECNLLEDIHYTGTAGDDLMADIQKDDNSISSTGGVTTEEHDGIGSKAESSFNESGTVGKSEFTTTKETENALITKDVNTENTYQMNGQDVSIEDIAAAGENAKVDTESKSTITITSAVSNSEGWTELAGEVADVLRTMDQESECMEVSVYVPDSNVAGTDLAKFAGKDVTLAITTNKGDVWKIDALSVSEKKVTGNTYDLSMTVTEVKAGKTKIESDIVFKVEFAEDVNFYVTVGIHVGHPYQLATLYENHFMSYDEIQTVVIDADGVAWFSLANIDKKTDYYVGINVQGKTEQDATVPVTLYEEYGMTEESATLTDAQGTAYKITGRTSSWGITGGQFALYVGAVIGLIILIVALAMFTWNKIQRSRQKYALDAEEDDEPIDEEALRMEIMRELLEKNDRKNKV